MSESNPIIYGYINPRLAEIDGTPPSLEVVRGLPPQATPIGEGEYTPELMFEAGELHIFVKDLMEPVESNEGHQSMGEVPVNQYWTLEVGRDPTERASDPIWGEVVPFELVFCPTPDNKAVMHYEGDDEPRLTLQVFRGGVLDVQTGRWLDSLEIGGLHRDLKEILSPDNPPQPM